MIQSDNEYTLMQKRVYAEGTSDHLEHDENPDYWKYLIKPQPSDGNISYWELSSTPRSALDFGCGKGRNVRNLQSSFFKYVDGVDISEENIKYCRSTIPDSTFYINNGIDLQAISSDKYDYVMSTIVFQHIPVHQIRFQLMTEIYRVLNKGGIFGFQMGFGIKKDHHSAYFDNAYGAGGTNGAHDVQVENSEDLINDLVKIGFINIEVEIKPSFSDLGHDEWIYVRCQK